MFEDISDEITVDDLTVLSELTKERIFDGLTVHEHSDFVIHEHSFVERFRLFLLNLCGMPHPGEKISQGG
jgi:hypothetical protein